MAPHDSQICGVMLQNANNRTQSLGQILRMVTMETAINSSRCAQNFGLHPAGMHCPAWDNAFGFLVLFVCHAPSLVLCLSEGGIL